MIKKHTLHLVANDFKRKLGYFFPKYENVKNCVESLSDRCLLLRITWQLNILFILLPMSIVYNMNQLYMSCKHSLPGSSLSGRGSVFKSI